MKRITDTVAKSLPVPTSAYTITWDSSTPGLGVRTTASGFRAWIFERRVKGKTKRRTLGAVSGSARNAISAEAARSLAIKLSGELEHGRDPVVEQRAQAKAEKDAALTFGEALQAYVDAGRERPLKERTRSDYLGMIKPAGKNSAGREHGAGELASIAEKSLQKLSGVAIRALRDKLLADRGPARAAYAMRVCRAVLNHHGVHPEDDPFDRTQPGAKRIRLPKVNARTNTIPPERLATWWKACSAAENGDKFQFALLTGMRPGEINGLAISDVDLEGGRIVLTDTKNGKPHVVLLSKQALAIAQDRADGKEEDEPLFEADPRKSQAAIIEASGVKFSPHDLRRTFGTIAASLLTGYTVKRLMNHADGNDVTAAHYVHLDEATLRAAWQTLADYIMKTTRQRPAQRRSAKVVPLRREGAA